MISDYNGGLAGERFLFFEIRIAASWSDGTIAKIKQVLTKRLAEC